MISENILHFSEKAYDDFPQTAHMTLVLVRLNLVNSIWIEQMRRLPN